MGGTGESYEEIVYEGYGPGGVAVIVETTTDNRNRTAGNVRSYFAKYHGNMGQTGCISFMFEEKGVIINKVAPEERAKMIEAEQPLYDQYANEYGVGDLIAKLQELGA